MKKILLLITALFINMNVFSSNKYYNITDYELENASPDYWEFFNKVIEADIYVLRKINNYPDNRNIYVECNADSCLLKTFFLVNYSTKHVNCSAFVESTYSCGLLKSVQNESRKYFDYFLKGPYLNTTINYENESEIIDLAEKRCVQEQNKLAGSHEF